MNCPVCRQPMIVLELDEVEIDHCTSCRGVWLDAGELELLLGNPAARDTFLHSLKSDHSTAEKHRRCPICAAKMEKIAVGAQKELSIDRCKRGDGIWLDGGELERILRMDELGLDQDREVIKLLKDIFQCKTKQRGG
ncbi:zf-TFIIB domain-containing protein [Candidatus Zixiibacteriota bacterium]